MKRPHGEVAASHRDHATYKYAYVLSIARKGKSMEKMIDRKNELLLRNGRRMQELKKIARDLKNAKMPDSGMTLFLNLLGDKLYDLSLWGDDMIIEGNISLPEAKEGVEEDLFLTLPTEEEITKAREENGDD